MATPSYQVPPPPPPMYGPAVGGAKKEEGKWGLVAGILLILAAIIVIGIGIWWAALGTLFLFVGPVGALGTICFSIPLICGIIGLLGGIFAIKRTHWAIALVGSILCIWSIFGLLALIFLIVGKDEFH